MKLGPAMNIICYNFLESSLSTKTITKTNIFFNTRWYFRIPLVFQEIISRKFCVSPGLYSRKWHFTSISIIFLKKRHWESVNLSLGFAIIGILTAFLTAICQPSTGYLESAYTFSDLRARDKILRVSPNHSMELVTYGSLRLSLVQVLVFYTGCGMLVYKSGHAVQQTLLQLPIYRVD